MVVGNKYNSARLGEARLGGAAFGVVPSSQEIPSEFYEAYITTVSALRADGKIQGRAPFSIIQPGTPPQVEEWGLFLECIACWHRQPVAGGVEPPDIGPRNRSWWYNASLGSGLFYYTYFMGETLPYRVAGNFPDWWDWP